MPISDYIRQMLGIQAQGQNPLSQGQLPQDSSNWLLNGREMSYGQRALPSLEQSQNVLEDVNPFVPSSSTRAKTPNEAAQSMRKVDADDMARTGRMAASKYGSWRNK